MEKYRNRQEAGQILARALRMYANRKDVLVFALPRGGVPVAYEIAKELHVPLDVFIVRKLGVPGRPELAMGAIAMGGASVLNKDIIAEFGIKQLEIDLVRAQEEDELKRRERAYRGNKPFPVIENKTIILVDDGIATGATMRAAIKALQQLNPASIVIAVPVADKQLCDQMKLNVTHLVCPMQPTQLFAVGAWYEDFSQTEDEEVYQLLEQANQ